MLKLKDLLTVEVSGKVVKIEIKAPSHSEDVLRVLNGYIDRHLDDLKAEEMIREYYNRVDRFIIFPDRAYQAMELKIEIERRLRLS